MGVVGSFFLQLVQMAITPNVNAITLCVFILCELRLVGYHNLFRAYIFVITVDGNKINSICLEVEVEI